MQEGAVSAPQSRNRILDTVSLPYLVAKRVVYWLLWYFLVI